MSDRDHATFARPEIAAFQRLRACLLSVATIGASAPGSGACEALAPGADACLFDDGFDPCGSADAAFAAASGLLGMTSSLRAEDR
jgi:hypothetical protein